jgi:hypothetical protein
VLRLFNALKSLKLALALIAYLAITGILVALVQPQGYDKAFYYSSFPPLVADLVVRTGFSDFYGSALFLIPAFLFFANLSACSAERFARELKKGSARRHGPDILHLGLILLLVGAVLGQAAKQSHPAWAGSVRLGVGEAVELPNGRLLSLKKLTSERYPDGRPKDWVSTVELSQGGKALVPAYEIRVNHPLRMGALSVFQASYGAERVLELVGPAGDKRSLAAGEYLVQGEARFLLMSVDLDGGSAVVREEGPGGSRMMSLGVGSRLGDFIVAGARQAELSGLQAAYDPFYPLVIAALVLIALGAFITFARRLGDIKA